MFGVEQLLSKMFPILLGWPFSGPVARKSKLSGARAEWDFFYLHPFVFLSWQLLSSKSVICEAKRKPRGLTTRVLGNQSPYIAGHLLSTFQHLLVFVYMQYPESSLHLAEGIRKSMSAPSSYNQKCPLHILPHNNICFTVFITQIFLYYNFYFIIMLIFL